MKNKAFGLLNVECALYTQMTFSTVIPAENITGVDETRRKILDKVGALPVVIWESNSYAVAARTGEDVEDADRQPVLKLMTMIDLMTEHLAKQR